MIFQDPFGSLNPRQTIGAILDAPLTVHRVGGRPERARPRRATIVGPGRPAAGCARPLSARVLRRPAPAHRHRPRADPRAGTGHLRRAGVGARPSIQAQILNLLVELKRDFGLSYLFISPRSLGGALLRRPRAGDVSRPHRRKRTRGTLWSAPLHPYTRALMAAVPDPARRRHARADGGDLPSPQDRAPGLPLPPALPARDRALPGRGAAAAPVAPAHEVACHHAEIVAQS